MMLKFNIYFEYSWLAGEKSTQSHVAGFTNFQLVTFKVIPEVIFLPSK